MCLLEICACELRSPGKQEESVRSPGGRDTDQSVWVLGIELESDKAVVTLSHLSRPLTEIKKEKKKLSSIA